MHRLSQFAAALLGSAALAQCPFTSASLQSYGQGCNPVFPTPPTFTVTVDPTTCTLQVQVSAFACCNSYVVGRLLGLGLQSQNVPLPWIGPGCTLLADPVILLYQPTSAGTVFVLSLPPVAPPVQLYAQGGVHYFTTIGFHDDFALTAGGLVTLQ